MTGAGLSCVQPAMTAPAVIAIRVLGKKFFTAVLQCLKSRLRQTSGVRCCGFGCRFEYLPSAAERLVEPHAVEQQFGVGVVCAELRGQSRTLRVEQRQKVDLPALVKQLRAAE